MVNIMITSGNSSAVWKGFLSVVIICTSAIFQASLTPNPMKKFRSFYQKTMSPSYLLNRALWGIIFVLLPLFYFQIIWINPVDFQSGGLGAGDFKAYFVASRLLEQGENIYDLELQREETALIGFDPDLTYYLYPSLLATLLLPISHLPIHQAALVWNTVNLLFLIAIVWLLTQTFDLRNRLALHYPWFVLLFFLAAPTTIALRIGQANIATLFFVTLCLWADQRGADKLSGFALALATLLKIFPIVLLIWFLWQKKYRTIVWFLFFGALLIVTNALFMAATGKFILVDWHYITNVLPNLQPPSQYDNHALSGFLYRFNIASPLIRSMLAGLVVLLSGQSFVRAMRTKQSEVAYAILLCGALLITSLTWTSTLIFLSIPIAVLLYIAKGNGRFVPILLIIGISYFCINSTRLLFNIGMPVADSNIILSLPFLGIIAIWSALVFFANNKGLPGFTHLLS